MNTRHDRIRAYYASFDEWARLDSSEGSIEYRRTLEILAMHLSERCRVLDLGGGPGRYSAKLARFGHRVVLADVSPALLRLAHERVRGSEFEGNIESIDEVNALDLGVYSSGSFDAVVALGPSWCGAVLVKSHLGVSRPPTVRPSKATLLSGQVIPGSAKQGHPGSAKQGHPSFPE